MNIPVVFDKDDTLNWYTNFLLSSLQNSIKNIQTNQLRILEPSVKNSIFCKEFERHFVKINIPTLLMYRQVLLGSYYKYKRVGTFMFTKCLLNSLQKMEFLSESSKILNRFVWIFSIEFCKELKRKFVNQFNVSSRWKLFEDR